MKINCINNQEILTIIEILKEFLLIEITMPRGRRIDRFNICNKQSFLYTPYFSLSSQPSRFFVLLT